MPLGNGKNRTTAMIKLSGAGLENRIKPVHYAPRAGYSLDLEVVPLSTLRRRTEGVDLRRPERIEFHLLIYVATGKCRHVVDFESFDCTAGSLLILRPGQVQRFDERFAWNGWLVLFRPEFLQPREVAIPVSELELFREVEALPTHLRTAGAEREAITESIERLAQDSKRSAVTPTVNALLRNQLHALLIRLYLIQTVEKGHKDVPAVALQRFRRYRLTVEREFRRWHLVGQYAKLLGCSEKSLSRATTEAAGVNAKSFLMSRIILEAKRLLAHTALPVSAIGDRLGFDEATNFVKCFRRHVGSTPGEFRAQQTIR
jgi:AraC-like DNA-binding protein